MKVFQTVYQNGGWTKDPGLAPSADWVLAFGTKDVLSSESLRAEIRNYFPKAVISGCTTSGSIAGARLYDESIVLTAVSFGSTRCVPFSCNIKDYKSSYALGDSLGKKIEKDGLAHVFMLADGHDVNGSDLVRSICAKLPSEVFITGGMAGDNFDFHQTHVWDGEHYDSGMVLAIALYGDALEVGKGYNAGWKPFGPDRLISRSENNVLYEIDHQPALEMYKTYLGEYAEELPSAALRFPLGLKHPTSQELVVRSILSIDEENQTLTFAGNVPEGASCQIMRANYENIVSASFTATDNALQQMDGGDASLAILVSCVGRRLVLGQRTEEEVDEAIEILPQGCEVSGFYSYGEISTLVCEDGRCGLLNQTMTVTLFREK